MENEKRMSDEQLEQYFEDYAKKLVAKNPLWYIDRIDFRQLKKRVIRQ